MGVELICTVLQVAPSTYYAGKIRPPSARQVRDAVMGPALVKLWEANYRVYGARKLWKAAGRAGLRVGRDQVARLMRSAGIEDGCRECCRQEVVHLKDRVGAQWRALLFGSPSFKLSIEGRKVHRLYLAQTLRPNQRLDV